MHFRTVCALVLRLALRGSRLPLLAVLALTALAPASAQDFTVVVLPDTQYYAQSYPSTFTAQTQWIANNISGLNIKAVVGVGDVVNGGGVSSEWSAADTSMKVIEGKVPYFLAIGNHDYNKNDPQNRTSSATNFNNHFGPSRYAPAYAGFGGTYSSGSNENFWGSVTINGKQYIFIMLEFYPRMSVVQWAAGVIRSHPSAEVILVTHGYEYNDNNRVALCNQYNAEYYSMGADNDGDELWVNLASQFPNVSMVLSGHIINGSKPSASHQSEPGFNGNLVNEVMADYQNLTNGGDGYLRIMKFQPSQNQIVVSTYSPTLNAYLTDSTNAFTIKWHQTTTSGTGTIKGRLKNTGCTAVSGAKVSYSGGSTTTDSSGNFTLSSVPSGVQAITVQAAGYPTITKLVPVGPSLTSNPLFFVSTSTGSVTGKLTDVSTGAALAGATVSSSGASTTTNSSGVYTLSGVSAVSAQVTASAPGYANQTQQISVTSGASSTLNFALTATQVPTTGTVTGTVTNSLTGAALAGASVLYGGGSAITNSSGSYTLAGVPKGSVAFTISATGMQTLSQNVNVVAGSTVTQNFVLTPIATGSVSGVVTDAYTNQPVSFATVAYSGGNTATDANGRYTLSGVPTGTQTITASATSYQNASQSVSITQNGNATANFSLKGSAIGTLTGTVTDSITGLPILGASLTYRGGNTLTNQVGSYTMSNVPAGTSTLSATAAGYIENDRTVTVLTGQSTTQDVQLVPVPTFGTVSGVITAAATNAALGGASVSCGGITGTSASDGTYQLVNVPTGSQTLTVELTGYQESSQQLNVSNSLITTANVALTSTTGSISGKVTDASTNVGVSGVTITVSSAVATTDNQGTYVIRSIQPGPQTVTATLSGYQVGTKTLTVIAGQNANADFALVQQVTTGSVSGTVTDSSNGLPISGATVTSGSQSATTDNNGAYQFSSLSAGSSVVTAAAPNYQDGSQTVVVVAGASVSANFALDPSTGSVLPTVTGAIAGTVLDAQNNTPIAGVTVSTASGNAITDASGKYGISNVAVGSVNVTATASGYAVSTLTASVQANQTTTQDFALTQLSSTGSISGTVTDASTAAPLQGATVSYSGGSATTDSTGAFTLSNVPPGAQNLLATRNGYANSSVTPVTVVTGQATTQNFALTAVPTTGNISGVVTDQASNNPVPGATVAYAGGSTTTAGDGSYSLTNVPAGSQSLTVSSSGFQNSALSVIVVAGQTTTQNFALVLAPTTGSVSGHVTNSSSGAALAGATVSYGGGSTTTDANGAYTLANLAAGTQSLTASLYGYNDGSGNVVILAGSTITRDFALSPLPTAGSATGTVKDSSTGAPIPRATVQSGTFSTLTDSSGAYTLNNLPAGTQSLTANAGGYSNRTSSVLITAGGSVTANFVLTATPTTGTITGAVTDAANSAGIAGATVSFSGGSATTSSSGTFTLTGVPSGSQTITVAAAGYANASRSVAVTAGSTTSQSFALSALPKVGTITGKVTNTSGTALTGATVAYSGGSALTDANGNFSLTNVPAGAQTLTASLSGYSNISQSVSVTANQTVTQNFALTAATGSVSGTITNAANGSALSGAKIAYFGGSTTSASNGTFALTNVPAGSQNFTLSLSGYTSVTKTITVLSGQTASLNVALTATKGSITGKITNASTGSAISGATITVAGLTATSDTSGVYNASGISTGSYSMTVSKSGWSTRTLTVNVVGGTTVTQNVPLATTGVLTGTVKTASGALDAGATVTVTGGVVATTVTLTTSSTGVYKTGWIPVGSYTVRVSQSGHTTKSSSATISAGATTTLNFTGF